MALIVSSQSYMKLWKIVSQTVLAVLNCEIVSQTVLAALNYLIASYKCTIDTLDRKIVCQHVVFRNI